MGVKVTNNAYGTISAGISSSDTTITLDSGQGARFPTLGAGDYFYGTLVDTSNNVEIVKVTARSTDSMTVTRGQDNTTAQAFSIGDRFELRPTAALFEDIITEASLADGDKGDITVSSSGATWNIDANTIGASELNVSGNGTSGQALLSDGDGTFSWGDAGGGKVLQVVQFTESSDYSTTSTSFQQGPQTSTFTLSSSSNKVLVTAQLMAETQKGSASYPGARYALYRGSISSGTRLTTGSEPQFLAYGANDVWGWQTLTYLDTPSGNTTYSIGYNCHPHPSANGGNAQIKGTYGLTVITMMEIEV